MVVRKRSKMSRKRGSWTYGYGAKKKHRGKGSRGGRGYAGSHKHRYTYIVKYERDHFYHKKLLPKPKARSINVADLDKLTSAADKKEIDLTALGYGKLLGSGEVSKAYVVNVIKCSKQAREKIEKAGGKIIESGGKES